MTTSLEVSVNLTENNVKVISLEHLKDRHEIFNKNFKESNIPYSFEFETYVKLVSSNQSWFIETPHIILKFPVETFKHFTGREDAMFSELAITAKHCELYKKFLASNENFLMIFEDDVRPCINKEELEFIISEFLQTDGDMLYLQSDCPWQHIPKTFQSASFNKVSDNLIDVTQMNDVSGISAYCLNRKGAFKLLNFYINNGIFQIIDSSLYQITRVIDFKIYTHKNYSNMFKISDFTSTHRTPIFKLNIK